MNTFTQYLEAQCFDENPEILDDNMPDFFDNWLSEQDVDTMIIHADGWMNETKSLIAQEIRKIL